MNESVNFLNELAWLWLKSKKIPAIYKKHIYQMDKAAIKRCFSNDKMLFGTAGIRSTIGPGTNQMNVFTYQQMAEGFARHLLLKFEKPTVFIGHDSRKNADLYTKVVANVLTSFGIAVILPKDNQMLATPIVSYAVRKLNLQGGIVITASHNPKDYLGFKCYDQNGCQISAKDGDEIVTLMPENNTILENEYKANPNLIRYLEEEIQTAYFADAKNHLIKTDTSKQKPYPIVFTAHHGTSCYDLPKYLLSLGYTNIIPVKEQCYPDPDFPNSNVLNPEVYESFNFALKYADYYKSDLIIALDPDADRLGVAVRYHENWYFLNGNEIGILFTYYLLKNKPITKPPFIVSTFVTNYYIDRIAKDYQAKVFRTATGFRFISEIIEKNIVDYDFIVAFEEAIGLLSSPIIRDKDGIQAAALLLEIYEQAQLQNLNLMAYLNQIYTEYGYFLGETYSYRVEGDNWETEIVKKFDLFRNYKPKQIAGYKIVKKSYDSEHYILNWQLENEMWVKFRISGTEPKFKVYFNLYGDSLESCHIMLNQLKSEIDYLLRT